MKLQSLFLVLICFLAETVWASQLQRRIRLGVPQYSGSGCPMGSSSSTVSPDEKFLSVLFDEYFVEAGVSSGNLTAEKSCTVLIPMALPPNTRLAVVKVDYRGFKSLPLQAGGRFSAEHRFRTRKERLGNGPILLESIHHAREEMEESEFLVSETKRVRWSDCHAAVGLQINTRLFVRTNRAREDALMSMDSMDMGLNVSRGLRFELRLVACDPVEDASI